MPDAVICEPLRTPVGPRFGGVFRDVAPEDLAATVITETSPAPAFPVETSTTSSSAKLSPAARRPRSGELRL